VRNEATPHEAASITWLTGLPASGKSTIATAVARRLQAWGFRAEVLDGDVLRQTIGADLGFSREDRDENVARIAALARTRSAEGIHVVCAVVSPYRDARERARQLSDRFVEVYVSTPLEVCQARDEKGLYRRARAGQLHNLTGVDDPYERPPSPDVEVSTGASSSEACADAILAELQRRGYLD
jgi:adenylylsulfate kinase